MKSATSILIRPQQFLQGCNVSKEFHQIHYEIALAVGLGIAIRSGLANLVAPGS
jgi:hypothetical protein